MAACPRLTELTLIYPRAWDAIIPEPGVPLDRVRTTQSATIELVNACKALPGFNTLQIVQFLGKNSYPTHGYDQMEDGSPPPVEPRRQALMDLVEGVKGLAIKCLRAPKLGYQEGAGKKKITLRLIWLGAYGLPGEFTPGPVRVEEVEEYEVWGSGIGLEA